MAKVMIKCAKCGREMPTGLQMDVGSFASATLTNNKAKCPHCGEIQTWEKKDAYLK